MASVLSPLLFGFVILVVLMWIILIIFFPETVVLKPRINATDVCISKCKSELTLGKDLSNGPCLLDPIPLAEDWVCDVAHWPREKVDDLPENQCSTYREGKATNFVEVTPKCEFIRASETPTHIFVRIKEDIIYYFGRLIAASKKLIDTVLSSLKT
jgi:hypothetical protein